MTVKTIVKVFMRFPSFCTRRGNACKYSIKRRGGKSKQQVQPVPHTIYQRGVVIMRRYEIVNYIEVSGEMVQLNTLSESEAEKVAVLIQDSLMERAGYQRKTA